MDRPALLLHTHTHTHTHTHKYTPTNTHTYTLVTGYREVPDPECHRCGQLSLNGEYQHLSLRQHRKLGTLPKP